MSDIPTQSASRFKIIGVGGIGCQIISQIATIQAPIPPNIEFIAMDTDIQDLEMACVPTRIQLGMHILHGLDCGTDPGLGRRAAEESHLQIRQSVRGADIVFIIAAMGGGTGTGSAPVITEIAHQMGILTIGMVTIPFSFEGIHRMTIGQQGVAEMNKNVDSLVTIPLDSETTLFDGKRAAREVIHVARDLIAEGIDMLTVPIYFPCLINLTLADISSILKGSGLAKLSTGTATGKDRAAKATCKALANLALGTMAKKAAAAIFTTIGNNSMTLIEVNSAARIIREELHPEANIIFSTILDGSPGEEMKVTLLVTRFLYQEKEKLVGANRFQAYRRIIPDPAIAWQKPEIRN